MRTTRHSKTESRRLRSTLKSGLASGGRKRRGNWGTWEQRVWKIFDPEHPFQN
jgi:hypothetical protein